MNILELYDEEQLRIFMERTGMTREDIERSIAETEALSKEINRMHDSGEYDADAIPDKFKEDIVFEVIKEKKPE